MEVSTRVKEAYLSDSVQKYLFIEFPELQITIENDQIYTESMQLTESLMDRNNVEFVGCISSCFKVKVHNLRENVKGKRIIVYMYTVGTEDEPITLFRGTVDSVVRDSNKLSKQITAYDALYEKGNIDVASWYQNLSFPISIKSLRNSLFTRLGIQQVSVDLPNDNIVVSKIYDPKTLQALIVLKSICQINGVMGIMNREGKFDYRTPSNITVVPFPSIALFPATDMYPSGKPEQTIVAENIGYYRSLDFEEYTVRPVDKVIVRDNEDDVGAYFGSGDNAYIIQNNMFAKKLDASTKATIARNVYNRIQGIEFTPFSSRANGLPWAECGFDAINCYVYNYNYVEGTRAASVEPKFVLKQFQVFNRNLSGVQALIDNYDVKGDEYQKEFITDIRANIDLVKDAANFEEYVRDYTYDYDELDTKFDDIDLSLDDINTDIADIRAEIASNPGIISVTYLPTEPIPGTIYLIQGYVRTTNANTNNS